MSQIFPLPDVGEGLTEAEILSWKVAVGTEVAINDVLVEIETAKSVVELPSPFAGTIEALLVAEGETVEVGTPIISISGGDSAPAAPAAPAAAETESGTALVGSGPKADAVKRRARKRPASATQPAQAPVAPAAPAVQAPVAHTPADPVNRNQGLLSELAERASRFVENTPLNSVVQRLSHEPAAAAPAAAPTLPPEQVPHRPTLAPPPVRLAAKELGVDLANVTATGARGQVTKQDLMNYVAHLSDVQHSGARQPFWQPAVTPGDRIERIPVRGVRKATAKAMVSSAFSAPHVSIFVDVDASRTMEFVKRLKKSRHFEGVKVTPLLVLAAAVIWAAERNPQVNATWTDSEIQIKHFMNLGIAAATPRGLMVPNIKDAQELSLRELAIALNNLTTRAREGKTQPAEMANGTLTITNIGSLGIDTGTPIINPGEVAIVAFGTIKQKPWVVDGEVIPRWVTTLGGSFDHRVVDGDLSARFMADVAAILEEPALLLDH
ncbi:MAG: 2-oxo acid dehydrogenase subunit E2 [Rothia sp.]|uniref:dihydrolipoamide acetyltransferase family protein n=1 Tax=Rothia sp. (in: high G+C Gram-positive bacteria) TaxID=1885016 RepID=UPI001CB47682|nr:dihydrolipoamide acetyltransferase family protein [Rothia sp. (in: high G+C Gram-positive bacteria)]MBF1681282.1 2-oxo acid dehydrogenase subunit E2 [Rothia sp. (in: high G+C Gram-positive bacteria)]